MSDELIPYPFELDLEPQPQRFLPGFVPKCSRLWCDEPRKWDDKEGGYALMCWYHLNEQAKRRALRISRVHEDAPF